MSKPPFVSEQVGVFAEQVLQFLIQLDADIGVQLGVDLQRLAELDVHRRRACGQADGAKAKHGDDLTLADHGADLRRRRWKSPPSNAAASEDRKSTRLNSSHVKISYAVFCLKKKKTRST